MTASFVSHQFLDRDGNPEGGQAFGPGFSISWQCGPLGTGVDRVEPNGAFVETLIEAVIDRIEFYQRSKFACMHNQAALAHLYEALETLNDRTKTREVRGVEGTHSV